MNQSHAVELSLGAILKLVLIVLGLFFLFLIRDILLIFFIAIILALAFDTPIDWLQKRRLPRILGTIFFYLLVLILISLVFYLIAPPLAEQTRRFANHLPFLVEKSGAFLQLFQDWWQINNSVTLQDVLAKTANSLTLSGSRVFSSLINLFGGLFSFLLVLIIAMYLNAREKGVKKFLLYLVPVEHHIYALNLIDQIQRKIGGWLWGRVYLSLIVALVTYLGLLALGVEYALVLGILAGLLDIIPYIGPVVAAVPAVILAFSQSFILGFLVIILYLVINSVLEGFLIQPLLMKKVVGIDPLLIIFVVLVGGKLAGLAGIILAIPLAAIIGVLVQEYIKNKAKALGAEIEQ